MNSQQLALEIVHEADKYLDISRPMPTVYYLFFAGRYMGIEYSDVVKITRAEWQEAKTLVYGDKFEMRSFIVK